MAEPDLRSLPELFSAATDWSCEEGCGDWTAVVALHWLGSREVLDHALKLTTSDDPCVRARAGDILGQLGLPNRTFSEECLRATISLLSSDSDPCVLEAAAVALGHLPKDSRGTSALVKLVDHDDSDVRFGVAFALGGRTDPEAIAALIRLTDDHEDEVRDWATFGLGRIGECDTPEIRDAFHQRLGDVDEDTRIEAICGLARCGDSRVVESLIKAMKAMPENVWLREAAQTLLKIDDDDISTEALMTALEASN
jgi:HEAT repeat protein